MRLLIESRKLTIELASTKHTAADHIGAHTFVSNTKQSYSHFDRIDTESLQSPTDYEKYPENTETSVSRYTELPRRKSIHKRIGRIFLRISRMCSDTQCSGYAYQYPGGATELPASEAPIEGTNSFYEMPGSYPRVELESKDMEKSPTPAYPINMQYAQTTPDHIQNYHKANQNATLRKAAPLSVASLPQLPMLEIPQSQNRIPRLISDHSPLTPSPISPMTPEGNITYGHRRPSYPQEYLDTVSPCTIPKHGQIFAHYGFCEQQRCLAPATPSTASSFDRSYTTTPLSAYPSSASSFQSWPQSSNGLQPPMFSQAYSPLDYNLNTNTTFAGPNLWQDNFHFQANAPDVVFPDHQMQEYRSNVPVSAQSYDPTSQAQSCFKKQRQLDTTKIQATRPHTSHTFDDAPPAYTPILPDLPLITTDAAIETPPIATATTTNPQQRYPPVVCQQCGKVYTGKFGAGNCKRHIQQVHASMFERAIHMCNVCMKRYNRADALRKHQWKKHRLEDARPNKRRDRSIQ